MPAPLADPERFAALAAAVADPVPRYLWRRTNESQTDDVLAATLDVLHRRADDLPDVDPVAWAIGVARLQLQSARLLAADGDAILTCGLSGPSSAELTRLYREAFATR